MSYHYDILRTDRKTGLSEVIGGVYSVVDFSQNPAFGNKMVDIAVKRYEEAR